MGKKSRKKKKRLARLRAMQRAQNNGQNQPIQQPKPNETSKNPQTPPEADANPTISLEDTDATPPKSPVASEIKKIAILMTSLAAVVVVVAIINSQTNYINIAGEKIMQVLHIYGS